MASACKIQGCRVFVKDFTLQNDLLSGPFWYWVLLKWWYNSLSSILFYFPYDMDFWTITNYASKIQFYQSREHAYYKNVGKLCLHMIWYMSVHCDDRCIFMGFKEVTIVDESSSITLNWNPIDYPHKTECCDSWVVCWWLFLFPGNIVIDIIILSYYCMFAILLQNCGNQKNWIIMMFLADLHTTAH